MPTRQLQQSILEAAILGFEAQKKRIDSQIAELRQMLSGEPIPTAARSRTPAKHTRRSMSAAGRKAISEASKRRWAAFHATSGNSTPKKRR